MKRLATFLLTFLFLFLIGGTIVSASDQQAANDIDVTISIYYDEDNIVPVEIETENLNYGDRLSFDTVIGNIEGYEFVGWLLNDKVVFESDLDREFVITNKTNIKAIFKETGKYAAVFMDTNGKLLDVQYVEVDEEIEEPSVEGLSKPGYKLAADKWDKPLTNINEDQVFVLQYEPLDEEKTVELTVDNLTGISTENYNYNSIIKVTADPAEDTPFSHWEVNGRVVSTKETYSFTLLKDMTIKAVYQDPAADDVNVTISDNLKIREGYNSYLGQFTIPEGYELIEFGMLTYNDFGIEFNVNTEGVKRYQGFSYEDRTNEWLMSFDPGYYVSARAYIVLEEQATKSLTTHYSEIVEEVVVSEKEIYSTGFEDETKQSYAKGDLEIKGITWTLNDALVGNLEADKKNGSKSVRLQKSGILESKTAISNITKITFSMANYGTNTNGNITVQVSVDGENWVTVMGPIAATAVLTEQTVSLTDNQALIDAEITQETPLYIKFVKSGGNRVNLDDLKIYGLDS